MTLLFGLLTIVNSLIRVAMTTLDQEIIRWLETAADPDTVTAIAPISEAEITKPILQILMPYGGITNQQIKTLQIEGRVKGWRKNIIGKTLTSETMLQLIRGRRTKWLKPKKEDPDALKKAISQAHRIIAIMHAELLDQHGESWPEAEQWLKQWS